jgi:uncharacterized damage-inducible protein DinB
MENNPDPVAVEFLHYNRWANLAVIDACARLTPEQLASSSPGSYGTIYETLKHIIRAEAGYYHLLTEERLPPPFAWEDEPTPAEMRPYAEQVSTALLGAAEAMLGPGPIEDEWQGEKMGYRPLTLLIQIVNHGVEHRTNITTILAQLGVEPPTVDGWEYMWTNRDRLGA